MASTTILQFPSASFPQTSNLFPTIPTFASQGSHIATPDLQIVFWGPYWPGAGQLSVGGIMQAVNTIVNSPYLEGLTQYGYTGPVKVRQPIVNTGNPNYTYPALAANVDQSVTTFQAVQTLVETLRQNNAMGDVSSNHDLIVFVFIDPSIPFPQSQDSAGIVTTIWGAHGEDLVSQTLAPAVRFCVGWSGTQPSAPFSAFDKATWTFSHELAEAISDPFGVNGSNTGWVQTFPVAPGGQGEIGDICTKIACVVDSIVVQPYWGVAQGACILPTETRTLSLNQVLAKHVPQDGPVQYGQVDLGPLCGKGNFDYVERTWDNVVSLSAVHPGYQAPAFTWSINGTVVKAGNSIMTVPAQWDSPTAPGYRTSLGDTPQLANEASLVAAGGAGAGMEPHGMMAARSMSSLGGVAPASHLDPAPGAPAGSLTQVQNLPAGDVFDKSLAALRITAFESVLTIECGPGAGNASFNVGCQAIEHWDNNPNTTATTKQSTSVSVTMTNQEIVWGASLQKAKNDCYAKTNKGSVGGNPVRPQTEGDPGPEGRISQVEQNNQMRQAGQLNKLK
jgi:hypothetical protein